MSNINTRNLCLTDLFIAPPCKCPTSSGGTPSGDTPNVSIMAFPYKCQIENGVLSIANDYSLYYIDCEGIREIVVDHSMINAFTIEINSITFTNVPSNIILKTYLDGLGTDVREDQYHSWIGTKLPSTATHYVWYHNAWTLYDDWASQFNQGGGGGEGVPDAD